MNDVVIVGAGLVGLASAWRVSRRGAAVTVIDDRPDRAASRTAAGMLAPLGELQYGEQALLQLGLAAARRYPDDIAELTAATGLDVGYRRCGAISVALDTDDNRALGELFDYATAQHLDIPELGMQRLRTGECRAYEPLLAPSIRGGIAMDSDHQVDPRKLLAALELAARHNGVTVRSERVTTVCCDDERVCGVRLGTGELVQAPTVVIAAGCWSSGIDGIPPDARPPIRPVKGELLRLKARRETPFLQRIVRGLVHGSSVYLVPRDNGEVILGATSSEQGFDGRTTLDAIYTLVRDARLLIPGITELELTEICTGLRPGSPDNAPIVGAQGPDGLLWATGHYRSGALLAPITGEAIAALATGGEVPAELAAFTPARFRLPAMADAAPPT